MSLQWQLSREIPEDTANIGQTILKSTNTYRQIGERFDALFPTETLFSALYEPTGRGAVSPLLLALVTVFQMLERLPDRVAADYVISRLDWKYALHLPLTYTGFHFTDLYHFRERLLEHGNERLVFDQFLTQLKTLGLIQARGKIRTDSTHLLAVVQRLSQLELITETLRVAVQALMAVAATWVEQTIPPTFREAYAERQSEFGLKDHQVQQRLVQAGKDGFWFLAQVEQSAPPSVRQLPEVETLRTVLEQQFPSGEGQPPTPKRPTGRDIVESPHEPEARYGIKRGKGWLGYKTQVTETCDADQPHLVVDVEVTSALANDSPELPHIQTRLQERDLLPSEQYVDQGYMSGDHVVASAHLGINLMGNLLDDTQGPVGFRQTDFQINEATHQALCPAEQTSRVWAERGTPPQRPPAIQIRFDGATCQACAFFGKCTTSMQGRSLTLHPYRAILQARRAEMQSESFREKLHVRSGIEGTLSELVRRHGFRSGRYRGQSKLRLQACFTAVAVNLKRSIRWWAEPRISQTASATG
jgi:transposase